MANFLHSKSSSDLGRLLLRLIVGGGLLFHGVFKLTHGIGFIVQTVSAHGLPGAFAYAVYLGEVLGPVLLIIGYKARVGGLLVAIDMVVAILLVHVHSFLTLNQAGGWGVELEMLYLVGGLAVFFMGAGKYRVVQSHGWGD